MSKERILKTNTRAAKKEFNTYDHDRHLRDEYGRFIKRTDRIPHIKATKTHSAYRTYIRSRLLEGVANAGLFIIWDFLNDDLETFRWDISYFRKKLNTILPRSDIDRLFAFYQKPYWDEQISDREKYKDDGLIWLSLEFKKIQERIEEEKGKQLAEEIVQIMVNRGRDLSPLNVK